MVSSVLQLCTEQIDDGFNSRIVLLQLFEFRVGIGGNLVVSRGLTQLTMEPQFSVENVFQAILHHDPVFPDQVHSKHIGAAQGELAFPEFNRFGVLHGKKDRRGRFGLYNLKVLIPDFLHIVHKELRFTGTSGFSRSFRGNVTFRLTGFFAGHSFFVRFRIGLLNCIFVKIALCFCRKGQVAANGDTGFIIVMVALALACRYGDLIPRNGTKAVLCPFNGGSAEKIVLITARCGSGGGCRNGSGSGCRSR